MPLSRGEKARRRLAKGLKTIANHLTIETEVGGSVCQGARDPYSNEYDGKRDRAYHEANPSAPVCVAGIVAATVTTKIVLGFHFPSLTDRELQYFGIGELSVNQAVFLVPYDQDVLGITRWQAPTGTKPWYRVLEGFPRTVPLTDVDIFYIAKGQREKE